MLTVADLHAAVDDERHLGWGYATADSMDPAERDKLDAAVIEVANDLGLDYERLFHWANSKYGRWLIDRVYGCNAPATAETVSKELNVKAMLSLAGEISEANRSPSEAR